jgi:hypothetical protein
MQIDAIDHVVAEERHEITDGKMCVRAAASVRRPGDSDRANTDPTHEGFLVRCVLMR